MTEALYLASDDLECTARVLSCGETQEGLWAVVCDRTVFHPQGGGQPSDIGRMNNVGVRKVIHTPDAIIHLCEAPLEGEVSMAVDGKTRRLHSRLHSAGHIIGFVGDEYGWHATKGNHFPGESRVVFEPQNPEAIQFTEAEVLQSEVNALISKKLERRITGIDGLRYVTWGDLRAYPCGGTHVVNTEEIGKVTISKIKMKKGQISVSYSLES